MKIIISSVFILLSFISFSKKDQKNDIIGIWKMDLYLINNDTIYSEKSEKFTLKYLESFVKNINNSDEKKIKTQNEANQLYKKFKTLKLHINKNTIESNEFDGTKSKMKLKYKIVNGKIILNEKLDYIIEYDKDIDILTIKQGKSNIMAINKYSRLTN